MNKEVKILGAGPAGLTAGINLAKAGYQVTVFEKNKTCGERFNGDFQGLENWSQKYDILKELKSMNINNNFLCKPFNKINLYDYKLNKTIIKSKKPFFYLVRRGTQKDSIDSGLMKQALDLGVKIEFNTLAKEDDCNIISKGPSNADMIAKGITFTTKMKDSITIILDDNIAPKGYAYLITYKGHGCLVTVLFKHFHLEQEYYKKMIERVNQITPFKMSNIKKFGGYGNFFLESKYDHEGKLYIGESIGLQDFLAGFGMRYAITSGYLASQSIIKNKDFNELIKERFDSQLKTSIVNRFLFELIGNKGYQILINMAKKREGTSEFLYDFYNTSLPKKLLLPIAKFKMRSKGDKHKDCYCVWCRSKKQEIN